MTSQVEPLRDQPDIRGLAHELANLMQVVNGNLELLTLRTTDDDACRYLANAKAAADQITALSQQLWASSRRKG